MNEYAKCWDCGCKFTPMFKGDDFCPSCFRDEDGYYEHLRDIREESIDGTEKNNKP